MSFFFVKDDGLWQLWLTIVYLTQYAAIMIVCAAVWPFCVVWNILFAGRDRDG